MRALLILAGLTLSAVAAGLFMLTQRGLSTRTEPSAVETWMAREVRAWSVPKNYIAMRNPVQCTNEAIAEGRAHWADHCAICHGNNGGGDTAIGRTMYPRPPDMPRAVTQTQSDGALYYTIENGVRLTGMPAFGESGDHTETWKLVCFIRHLPDLSEDEERQMKKLNPKTEGELEEERREEEFLNGGTPETSGDHHHR
jgi:mono/diheme cytochrome c family protein